VIRLFRKQEMAGSIPVTGSSFRRESKSGDCTGLKSQQTWFDPTSLHHSNALAVPQLMGRARQFGGV
jgi:hypothetical protein